MRMKSSMPSPRVWCMNVVTGGFPDCPAVVAAGACANAAPLIANRITASAVIFIEFFSQFQTALGTRSGQEYLRVFVPFGQTRRQTLREKIWLAVKNALGIMLNGWGF